jgi:ribosomal protein S14
MTTTPMTARTTSDPAPPRSDRWPCARCGRDHAAYRRWPEGHLCRTCVLAALDIHGVCPGCGDHRILPGRSTDGTPICPGCAGIVHSVFRCRRCHLEGRLYHGKLCVGCTVTDRVAALLDNGTGHVDPDLSPLAAALATGPTPTPAGRLNWLSKPRNRDLLLSLAARQLPLTHHGLTAHPDQTGIPYLRALLVACGTLPDLDRQLLDFEAWLVRRLNGLAGHPHERLLRQFGLWHQLPRMRTKAALAPLTPPARTYAQLEFIHATAFCTWLAEHGHHPTELGQVDLDHYYTALKIGHRQSLRGFLNWSMNSLNLPTLTFARTRFTTGEALTQTRRLDLLRDLVTDHDDGDDRPLGMRVAACVLLLYAQPVTRIMTLITDDIAVHDGAMTLKLGDPPAPVPEPFAALVRRLLAQRPAGTSRWLFPGRRPGQPLSYISLSQGLRDLGVPLRLARVAAIRQLALQAPAPVIAQALGFHHTTTHRQTIHAAGIWNRYAALAGAAQRAKPRIRGK